MKKQLFLTTAMAATLSGCSTSDDDWGSDVVADRDTRVCVDQNGYRVDDDDCERTTYVRTGGAGFLWYYVGRGSRLPYYGDSVRDPRLGLKGSYFPNKGVSYAKAPAAANMARSAAVSRGGFGSSGRSFGGGRS
jgi:hypothetical protein